MECHEDDQSRGILIEVSLSELDTFNQSMSFSVTRSAMTSLTQW